MRTMLIPPVLALAVQLSGCTDGASDERSRSGRAEDSPAPTAAAIAIPGDVDEGLRIPFERAHRGRFGAAARWARSAAGTYMVLWEPVGGAIPDAEPFAVAIGVARIDGRTLSPSATVSFDAEMPHHGHGMNFVPSVERVDDGEGFVASGALLHMPGRWVIAVDIEEDGILERAQWHVEIE